VPIKNPLELSKKIKDLILDQRLRLNMGQKSRILFEKEFTLKKIVDQTISVYKFVLKVNDLDYNKITM
jgi:glycosyltransferase involved in cell wall biosynthesis